MMILINIILFLTAIGLAFTSGYIFAWLEISKFLKNVKKRYKDHIDDSNN